MRSASTDLIAFLNGNSRSIRRHLITLTLADSTVIRWTDNEDDLTLDGNTFTAGGSGTAPIISLGKVTEAAGTEIGECELSLLCGETQAQLNGVRLPLAVVNGALDKAKVKIERVFGVNAIDLTMGSLWIFEGVVAEAKPASARVDLYVVDGREELQIQLPRTPIQPPCTAMLYDSQCSLSKATWTVTGTISSGATATSFGTSRTEADDYFRDGVITFTSGPNTGLERGIRGYLSSGGTFTLDEPLPSTPVAGDTFSVFPGCDHTLAGANGCPKFSNTAHFRGFYVVPSFNKQGPSVIGVVIQPGSPLLRQTDRSLPSETYLPIVYGRNKVALSTVYLFPFPFNGRIVYDVIWAACEGPVTGARRLWWNGHFYANWTGLNPPNPVVTFATGTRPTQTAWARSVFGKDPGAWTNYPGCALLRAEGTDTASMGGDTGVELEIDGLLVGTGDATSGDAHPADIVQDLLTDIDYGAEFSWGVVTDTGTDGTDASSYRRYVAEMGLWLSPVLKDRRPAQDWLQEILDSTNASARWTSAGLQIVPLADQAVGTYTPNVAPQYDLTSDHFKAAKDEEPIEVDQRAPEEAYNSVPVEFLERDAAPSDPSYAYQSRPVENPDTLNASLLGRKRAPAVSLPMICRDDVAMAISRLKAQRLVQSRNTFKFKLPWNFRRLEPLDYVTLTDTRFGFDRRAVRIRKMEEDANTGLISVEAEDAPIGHASVALQATQPDESRPTPNRTGAAAIRAHETSVRNWTIRSIPSAYYTAVAYGGGMIVAVGSDGAATGKCASSPDGVSWTARTIGASSFQAVVWNGSVFCAVGQNNSCSTSPDGITWTTRTIPAGSYFGLAWNGSVFCAVGNGVIATSPDGVTWTARTAPGGSHQAVVWNGSIFCAIGFKSGAQAAATSPDGITWTLRTTPTDGTYYGLAWNGTVFCAGGAAGAGATSADGITWEAFTIGSRTIRAMTWTGFVFLALDYGGAYDRSTAYTSIDGETWVDNSLAMPASGSNFGWLGVTWAGLCAIAVSDNSAATSMAIT